jgi:hypothetical protein
MALVSGVMRSYRALLENAFREFSLGVRFAAPVPNIERYKQFLTRIKEKNPDIFDLSICKDGLPAQWCYIQFTRGPLSYNADEHEFRTAKVRKNNPSNTEFEQYNLGFAIVQLNCVAFCNNDSSAEQIEEMYYRRLYKLRTIDHIYLDLNFHSRCDHSVISDFTLIPLEGDQASGWMIQWTTQIHANILMKDIEGLVVNKVTTTLYDRSGEGIPDYTTYHPIAAPDISSPVNELTTPAPNDAAKIVFEFTEDDIDHVGPP